MYCIDVLQKNCLFGTQVLNQYHKGCCVGVFLSGLKKLLKSKWLNVTLTKCIQNLNTTITTKVISPMSGLHNFF